MNPTYTSQTSKELQDQNLIQPKTRIRILSPEHSEYVQKLAFKAGFHWNITGHESYEVKHTDKPMLLFGLTGEMIYDIHPHVKPFGLNSAFKEIFIDLPRNEMQGAPDMNANKTANPFINTYIDISKCKKEDVLPLANKYSEASGMPLNEQDVKNNEFEAGYRFLACFPDTHFFRDRCLWNVCVTSLTSHSLQALTGSCVNQVTEQDLDNYLSEIKDMNKSLETSNQAFNKCPNFNFKISLEDLSKEGKMAAKQWIKEAALARFDYPDVSNLDFDSMFFWVSNNFFKEGGIAYSDNKDVFNSNKDPEIKLSFKTSVQNWSKDKSELLKRKAELEEALAKINRELRE